MSSSIYQFFEKNNQNLLNSVNTCGFARVVKVDMKYMRMDVQPLFEMDAPQILNVPIATHQTKKFFIRPPYKVGDIVLLIFSQRDIDPIVWEGGEASTRKLSIDDALVIGGVTPFTQPLPDEFEEHKEDFVIATRDYKTRLIITKDGDIIVDVDEGKKIYLADKPKNGEPEQGVPLGDKLKEWLDNHTHGPDGKPKTPSPEPSRKVKVQ